jgi:hypothetical protein
MALGASFFELVLLAKIDILPFLEGFVLGCFFDSGFGLALGLGKIRDFLGKKGKFGESACLLICKFQKSTWANIVRELNSYLEPLHLVLGVN